MGGGGGGGGGVVSELQYSRWFTVTKYLSKQCHLFLASPTAGQTSTSPDVGTEGKTIRGLEIAGLVIIGIVVVLVAVYSCWKCWRRRQRVLTPAVNT